MKLLRYVVKGPSASPSGDGARLFVLWLALLALPLLLCASPAPAGTAERVSVSSTGEQGDGQSQASVISADGRYVAFRSYADNLVSGDTNGTGDIFVHDRVTGATERVWEGDGPCLDISADGRFITFDDWIAQQIFVHDRVTGATELASVSSTGESSWGDVPAISGDGRYVAFQSWATNLVPGDTNGIEDVFVHDRLTGQTERVSLSSTGAQGNDMSDYASSLSVDGRYVVFESAASTLVPGDTNGSWDVFVRDRETDTTERVSVGSTGEEGNDTSYSGPISADGRYVVFLSWASNLVPEDTNGVGDVFLHDRLTGQTELLSVSSTGEQGDGESFPSAISADGRYVAFHSYATNLVPGDTNGTYDVFVHDRETGATERVSIGSAGEQGNGQSLWADMSPDARCVAFSSDASNLVPGDTNGATDILVRVRWRFQDVPPEQWAFAQVDACVSASVVKGYSDETYRPSDPVTRDQMAIYISRGIVAPSGDAAIPTGPAVATFSDVPTDHWAYKWVEYAVDQNVVQGYPDGTYRPDQQVDRGQMAIFVARGIVAPNGDAAVPTGPAVATFPDVPTDHWAYKWVEFIADEGVTQGYDDGTYRPAVIVTRDQMAVYVQRAFTLPM